MRELSDDEAWIVSHYLYLVHYYLRRHARDDANRDDLRAAGYLGLCHAISIYDPALGLWKPHAKIWIRKYIQMERAKLPIVWVPVYHRSHQGSESKAASKERHGSDASRAIYTRTIRWDDPEVADALAAMPCEQPGHKNCRVVNHCLDELNAKQRIVVSRIVMHGEKTADVARDIGLSRQRVEAIMKRAMQQLEMRLREMQAAQAAS